jgi:hypothetical protein
MTRGTHTLVLSLPATVPASITFEYLTIGGSRVKFPDGLHVGSVLVLKNAAGLLDGSLRGDLRLFLVRAQEDRRAFDLHADLPVEFSEARIDIVKTIIIGGKIIQLPICKEVEIGTRIRIPGYARYLTKSSGDVVLRLVSERRAAGRTTGVFEKIVLDEAKASIEYSFPFSFKVGAEVKFKRVRAELQTKL